MHTYSLLDLQAYIRQVLALNFQENLWITAEIAQAASARGHLFLDLVQKGSEADSPVAAKAQAVLWQRERQRLRLSVGPVLDEVLCEGREVRLCVRVDYHERHGIRLLVTDADPVHTFGRIELQRRQTLESLRQLGLLERNRALQLPSVLQRIAVITSEGAAGFQDFREHLAYNPFGYTFHCQLFSTTVQGGNLETEMIAAFEAVAAQRDRFDCAVVLRGGGARLDLSGFDSLPICKTAGALPLPLLTGIGHETDETVLDLVAHTALKTPTAVADFLAQRNLFFENKILRLSEAMQVSAGRGLKTKAVDLANLESVALWVANARVRAGRQQIDNMKTLLPVLTTRRIRQASDRLQSAEAFCAAHHPDAALRRGFSLTLHDGKPLTDADTIGPGDVLETRLWKGEVVSVVSG
ncbi:MAG: exodeoxyribonuclease VII large subunit [Saprospiraceae bacterium]